MFTAGDDTDMKGWLASTGTSTRLGSEIGQTCLRNIKDQATIVDIKRYV